MFPRPVALGVTLCDNVIIERDTNKVSLIGQFRRLYLRALPGVAPPFWVAAVLSGAAGRGTVRFEVNDLSSLGTVYVFEQPAVFRDRFAEYQILYRISRCRFRASGWYSYELKVDGETVAQRRLQVLARP